MKVDKTPFPSANMVEIAPAQQPVPPQESFASVLRMWSSIEHGLVSARTLRGENDACLFTSINMVSSANSAKGKEKADPDYDRLLRFEPERHVSAKEIARNRRSWPNSGALIGLYARLECQHDEDRHYDGRRVYRRERSDKGCGLHHSPRHHSRTGERRRETWPRQEERLRYERRHEEQHAYSDNGGAKPHWMCPFVQYCWSQGMSRLPTS